MKRSATVALMFALPICSGFAGSAFASDVRGKEASFWSGPYVGANLGAAVGDFNTKSVANADGYNAGVTYFQVVNGPIVNAAGTHNARRNAFTGGLSAGYNWERDGFVFGVEADVQSLRFRNSSMTTTGRYSGSSTLDLSISSNANTDVLFMLRPRAGWLVNDTLIYATGGLAVSRVNSSFAFRDRFGASASGSIAATKVGFVIGAGVETRLQSNWSVKAEYLYVDLGNKSVVSNNFADQTLTYPNQLFTHSIRPKENIVRIGLNYQFR